MGSYTINALDGQVFVNGSVEWDPSTEVGGSADLAVTNTFLGGYYRVLATAPITVTSVICYLHFTPATGGASEARATFLIEDVFAGPAEVYRRRELNSGSGDTTLAATDASAGSGSFGTLPLTTPTSALFGGGFLYDGDGPPDYWVIHGDSYLSFTWAESAVMPVGMLGFVPE